jgi:hypothetical protein
MKYSICLCSVMRYDITDQNWSDTEGIKTLSCHFPQGYKRNHASLYLTKGSVTGIREYLTFIIFIVTMVMKRVVKVTKTTHVCVCVCV